MKNEFYRTKQQEELRDKLTEEYEKKFGERPMMLVMQSIDGYIEMVEKALKTGKPIDYDEVRPQGPDYIY